MTNYNERLGELLTELRSGTINFDDKAKQALTSLIKELVAEAKPEVRVFDDGINDATYFQQKIVDQFEQNLLKALDTK